MFEQGVLLFFVYKLVWIPDGVGGPEAPERSSLKDLGPRFHSLDWMSLSHQQQQQQQRPSGRMLGSKSLHHLASVQQQQQQQLWQGSAGQQYQYQQQHQQQRNAMKRNGTVGNSRFRIQQHLINIKNNNNNNISSSSKHYFNNNNGNKYDIGEIL